MSNIKKLSYQRPVALLMCALQLFQRTHSPEDGLEEVEVLDDEDSAFNRIRCPLCQWQPSRYDVWVCGDVDYPEYYFGGCYAEWNTFETRGVCPGCFHQWRWTGCLSCHQWSLHEDWYVSER